MSYEYRKMTSEEREAVLRLRRARGYPLHNPPHPLREAGSYLITAATFEHQHILTTNERRTDLEARVLEQCREKDVQIFAWIILPNHYHLLVGVEALAPVTKSIKQLHGKTAREWNLADGKTGQRKVWCRYTDRKIRDQQHFYRALNYVHYNPVKHGYVDSVYAWPWSSVHNYLEHQGRDWLREKWATYKPDYMGKDWDED